MNNFDVKKKIVESGNSKVFNNWHELALIDKDEFLELLKWVCEDPLDDMGRMTREMGLETTPDGENCYFSKRATPDQKKMLDLSYDPDNIKGKLVKINRTYHSDHDNSPSFFKVGDYLRWEGHLMINCRDRI